jgi:hypothetical protein
MSREDEGNFCSDASANEGTFAGNHQKVEEEMQNFPGNFRGSLTLRAT